MANEGRLVGHCDSFFFLGDRKLDSSCALGGPIWMLSKLSTTQLKILYCSFCDELGILHCTWKLEK